MGDSRLYMMALSATMDIAIVRAVYHLTRMPSEHSVVVPNKTGVCNYSLREILVIEIYDTPDVNWLH